MIAIKLSMESILENILVFEDLSLRGFSLALSTLHLFLLGITQDGVSIDF